LVDLLFQQQSSVVLQELSSLEIEKANTQQWEEDKQTSLFSYFIIYS